MKDINDICCVLLLHLIRKLFLRSKAISHLVLKENIGEHFLRFRSGLKDVFNGTQKSTSKGKMNTLHYIKINNSCSSKNIKKRE